MPLPSVTLDLADLPCRALGGAQPQIGLRSERVARQ